MLFGFAAPPGDREMIKIDQATYTADYSTGGLRFAEGVFDSIWVSDHLMEGDRYRIEPWTQLTWIAARTSGVGLGNNVLANSYRHPALLAKMAASLQVLSGGRFILGYGAGWLEDEYRAYGYAFPSTQVRIAQMDEALRLIKALWGRGRSRSTASSISCTRRTANPGRSQDARGLVHRRERQALSPARRRGARRLVAVVCRPAGAPGRADRGARGLMPGTSGVTRRRFAGRCR